MVEFRSDIDAALSGDGPIPRARVISWIEAATDSDLSTLSKLYRLTGEGYYRIQPELGRETTCVLIQRYLLGCIRDGVTENKGIQERYEAAKSLHVWFRHLVAMDDTSSVLSSAASAVKNLYLENGQEVRDAIETGFLEHTLETNALRPYFEDWAFDARLQASWNRALAWGETHPDYMAAFFQQIPRKDEE